jgi:excisionase family DNA binding protein
MSVADAAKRVGIGASTMYRLIDEGVVPAVRVPKTSIVRVRRETLERVLKAWEGRTRRGRKTAQARLAIVTPST